MSQGRSFYEDGYNEGVAEFIRYLLLEGKNDDEIMKITGCTMPEIYDVKAIVNP